jgi:hypothetical protein
MHKRTKRKHTHKHMHDKHKRNLLLYELVHGKLLAAVEQWRWRIFQG